MRVTAFLKYGDRAASTRQRLLQYLPALEQAGIEVDCRVLLDNDYIASLAADRTYSKRRIATAYLKRMRDLAKGPIGDLIWVYAELFPYLPGWFERLALRRGQPIVYDCDDAFFHTYDDNPNPLVRALLARKLEPVLSGAAACTCGNAYLRAYASRFCAHSIVLPTVVDTHLYRPAGTGPRPIPVIGWIGSPTTWAYVRPMLPLLQDMVATGKARLVVVGAGTAAEPDRFPGMELRDWSEAREIADVQDMDIGIMPLPDQEWARGKCGYKLIQYMACGLPVVASPVGVNREIVRPDENGFLAANIAEWREALTRLLSDPELRARFGVSGRDSVEHGYSLSAHAPRLVTLLKDVAGRPGSN